MNDFLIPLLLLLGGVTAGAAADHYVMSRPTPGQVAQADVAAAERRRKEAEGALAKARSALRAVEASSNTTK